MVVVAAGQYEAVTCPVRRGGGGGEAAVVAGRWRGDPAGIRPSPLDV